MKIRELREKYKLTQAALAKSLGVSSITISAVETGRTKLSGNLSARIQEVYGEFIEPETRKVKAAEKSAAKKTRTARKKAEAAVETAAAEAVLDAGKKLEKKTRKTKAKLQAEKPSAETTAEAVAELAAEVGNKIEKKAKRAKRAKVVIQSPMGGEITAKKKKKKIGQADTVYVRVDQNKAYWVKGDETGSVDLW